MLRVLGISVPIESILCFFSVRQSVSIVQIALRVLRLLRLYCVEGFLNPYSTRLEKQVIIRNAQLCTLHQAMGLE